jgi:hypothetical protein
MSAQGRPNPSEPPNESGTRIRSAGRSTLSIEQNIEACIDFAISELESLEVPYTASAPPLAIEPAQQMPRGMPPLPFLAPHPRNMPPLPAALSSAPSAASALVGSSEPSPLSSEGDAPARPSRWLLFVALGLGIICLSLAFWLQSH